MPPTRLPALLEIMRVPVISTAHMPGTHALATLDCGKLLWEYGGIICVSPDNIHEQPEWLAPVAEWALLHGFYWVRFDGDADPVPGLPTYDWSDQPEDRFPVIGTCDLCQAEVQLHPRHGHFCTACHTGGGPYTPTNTK